MPYIAVLYNMHSLLIVSGETYIIHAGIVTFVCQGISLDSLPIW